MKNVIANTLVIFFLFSTGESYAASDAVKPAKSPLVSLSDNGKFKGDQFPASVTVVQFWASWCTGCGVVMSQMAELLPKHPKVAYVNISLDETKEVALKFFANKSEQTKTALKFGFLDGSGQDFAELNKVDTLPYLFVVNNKGEILKRIKGHPTKEDLEFITK